MLERQRHERLDSFRPLIAAGQFHPHRHRSTGPKVKASLPAAPPIAASVTLFGTSVPLRDGDFVNFVARLKRW
jgi:hypothetical protein